MPDNPLPNYDGSMDKWIKEVTDEVNTLENQVVNLETHLRDRDNRIKLLEDRVSVAEDGAAQVSHLEIHLRERDKRIKILEDRMSQLEDEVARTRPAPPDQPFMPTVEATKCDTCGMVFPLNQAMGWVCGHPNCPTTPRCT